MQDRPAEPTETSLSTIVGVALLGLAALAGAFFWTTSPTQTAERAARDFLQAVMDGDRSAARTYLSADLRKADEARSGTEPWKVQSDTRLTIESAVVDGLRATVKASLERDSYHLRPVLTLEQTGTGPWKIIRITGLEDDPSWIRDRDLRSNEALADDIAKALNVPLEEPPSF